MPRLSARFTLGELMGLVAAIALAFGVISPEPAIAFSVVALLFTGAAATLATGWRLPRLTAAVALYSFYPALPVVSRYLTWVTAWLVLGHPPRAGSEAPQRLGPVVRSLDDLTGLLLTGCVPAFVICGLLSYVGLIRTARRINAGPVGTPPDRVDAMGFYAFIAIPVLGWGSSILTVIVDPLGLLSWNWDE